jgi:hypothetical protein
VDIIEMEGSAEVCKVIKEQVVSLADCEAIVQTLWDISRPDA